MAETILYEKQGNIVTMTLNRPDSLNAINRLLRGELGEALVEFDSDPEAYVAIITGAGPVRFFLDILVPLSKTMMAAIFIIMFVVGWNQYLWPLLMTTDDQLYTIVIGIKQVYNSLYEGGQIPQFPKAFALTIMATIPPVLVVVIFQRMFVKGLVETEK